MLHAVIRFQCKILHHNVQPLCRQSSWLAPSFQHRLYKFSRHCLARCPKNSITNSRCRMFTTSGCRNTSHSSSKRTAKGKLPFEIEADKSKDIKVFMYNNDRMYKMMTVFGIVQFFFWGNMAMFSYSTFKKFKANDNAYVSDSWSGSVIQSLSTHSYKISAMCMLLGHIVLAFTFIYPLRTVAGLVLLRGGKEVRVTTYSHFGKKTHFTVPVDSISCHQSRMANTSQVSLKVKGRWLYYLMDKRDGVFHDTRLFDQVVGLKRDFKLQK